MKKGGASKQSGLRVGRRELAWRRQRCGDEGKRKDGREVAMPGMSKVIIKEAMGRLAWSKVSVTMTSLALVSGVSVGNTVIRCGRCTIGE